jgi:hypothetical protein
MNIITKMSDIDTLISVGEKDESKTIEVTSNALTLFYYNAIALFAFSLKWVVFGGYVRDRVVRGEMPNDIDIAVPNLTEASKCFDAKFGGEWTLQLERDEIESYSVKCRKYRMTHSLFGVVLFADLVENGCLSMYHIDFDVNALVMSQPNCISLRDDDNFSNKGLCLSKVLKNVHDKKFEIISRHTHIDTDPRIRGSFYNLKRSARDSLILHSRTQRMLDNGWSCVQDLKTYLRPCLLILKTEDFDSCETCSYRADFKPPCCTKSFCFRCMMGHRCNKPTTPFDKKEEFSTKWAYDSDD